MIHLHTRGASQVVLGVNAGDIRDVGSVPRLGRSPGEGNGKPFQCSCLENPMDRGAWRATVHGLQSVGHDRAHTQHRMLQRLFYF